MTHSTFVRLTWPLALLCAALSLSLSCSKHAAPALKRYPFTGRIVLIDKANQSAIIAGDAIPGFMEAMAMDYKIKSAADAQQLAAGDFISAVVVVAESKDKESAPDYWLENVKVTGHVKPAGDKVGGKPTSELRVPAAGKSDHRG